VKTCSKCGEEKELDQFHRNRSMSDGRLNECKDCANAKRRAHREEHGREGGADRSPEARREHYAANRERLNAQARARYAADPERHRAWMRQERAKDPAKVRARAKAWRDANPDKVKESNRRRYAAGRQRYAVDALLYKHGMTIEQWTALWDSQDGRCYLCRRPMSRELTSKDGAVIDHDHSCCGQSRSCSSCRRGMACRLCNLAIGCAGDDPARLRLVAHNLEAAIRSLAARQAGRPLALPLRDGDATNETATA
jgi:hypothetical protein